MHNQIKDIRKDLLSHIDPNSQHNRQYYFKEEINCYGLKNGIVHKIASNYINKLKVESKADIFSLCDELFQSGNLEESIIACDLSYSRSKSYQTEDFEIFEKWIDNYINNWATCDTFCNHNMGYFLEKFPEYITKTIEWTKSKNRWVRRAAAVSLIVPAKKGKFLNEILEIATLMLKDKDDMVQKGYGWMLKVACQQNRLIVFGFVMANKAKMPRTALRYAIEKMPADLKALAMGKG